MARPSSGVLGRLVQKSAAQRVKDGYIYTVYVAGRCCAYWSRGAAQALSVYRAHQRSGQPKPQLYRLPESDPRALALELATDAEWLVDPAGWVFETASSPDLPFAPIDFGRLSMRELRELSSLCPHPDCQLCSASQGAIILRGRTIANRQKRKRGDPL